MTNYHHQRTEGGQMRLYERVFAVLADAEPTYAASIAFELKDVIGAPTSNGVVSYLRRMEVRGLVERMEEGRAVL